MASINIKNLLGNGAMAYDKIYTEGPFEWFKLDDDGYIYVRNSETGRNTRYNGEAQNGKRISDEEYFTKCNEVIAREEEKFENELTPDQIDSVLEEIKQGIARGELVEYKGDYLPVRECDSFYGDPMNSCFFTKVDVISGYEICRMNDSSKEMFALRNKWVDAPEAKEAAQDTKADEEATPAPKAKKRAKKTAAYTFRRGDFEVTLTEKQVDFIRHLPDTCFWERGVCSIVWVDVLCDEIGGQFANKPMTVGAMVSTLCEKGLGERNSDRRNGRKCTAFALTGLGQMVARDLGLK